MAGGGKNPGLLVERAYPLASALVAMALVFLFSPSIFAWAAKANLHIEEAYNAIFNLAAVLTGFLFTFYSFVVTTDRGFLGSAKTSVHYKRANGYTLAAIRLGGALTVASIPLIIWQPAPIDNVAAQAVIAVWTALVVWAILAFERATRIFAIFATSHEQLEKRAA